MTFGRGTVSGPIAVTVGSGDSLRVMPMTDHYAITANGELVAVVCRANEFQWAVDVITGRIDGVDRYIPLADALRVAMTWRR